MADEYTPILADEGLTQSYHQGTSQAVLDTAGTDYSQADPAAKLGANTKTTPPSTTEKLIYSVKWLIAASEHQPLRIVRVSLWVILGGWLLFLHYALAGLLMCATVILFPFGYQALQLAVFAFNPVSLEITDYTPQEQRENFLHNPMSFFNIVANIVWLFLFGWNIFLNHMILSLVQALTIFGIPNAISHLKIGFASLWPFGKKISKKEPTPYPAPLAGFTPSFARETV
ncbi:hypothetical protein BJ742DRAFT_806023 [Cladochytrium replicatum]|nr:hypothetical protein BJ742DRAFT_806023 [Cladochytrium replicatum]